MQSSVQSSSSLAELIKEFREEAKTFVKQEVQLAKTEISEKIAGMRRNAVMLAIGGFVAYAGCIVLFGAIGVLLAAAFERIGLDPTLALCAGLGAVSLIVAVVGGIMIAKALAGFSKGGSM